jgi:hypothetical protein
MQNPLYGKTPENEAEEDKIIRSAIWEALLSVT